jgi:hypothetical protein
MRCRSHVRRVVRRFHRSRRHVRETWQTATRGRESSHLMWRRSPEARATAESHLRVLLVPELGASMIHRHKSEQRPTAPLVTGIVPDSDRQWRWHGECY